MKRVLLFALFFGVFFGCKNQLDDGKPRLYKCARDGGEACPGGWTCGLEGYCHSPDAEGAFKCEHSSDCGGGWHCGVRGVCYAPTTTTEPCRQDAGAGEGSDCAEGFRCGLEDTCHPTGVAGPYKCQADSDCESGWRCGQDNVCVDVQQQSLLPTSVTIDPTRFSPALPPSAGATAFRMPLQNGTSGALAFAHDGGVTQFLFDGYRPNAARRFDFAQPGPVSSLVIAGDYVLVSGPNGVQISSADIDGGGTFVAKANIPNARFVQGGSTASEEQVEAFDSTTIASQPGDNSPFVFAAFVPSGVNSLTRSPEYFASTEYSPSLLAATSSGLYLAPSTPGAWVGADGGNASTPEFRPVALPGLPSSCGGGAQIDRAKFLPTIGQLAVTTGGDSQLRIYTRPGSGNPAAGLEACDLIDTFTAVYGPCPPCGPGEELIDLGSGDPSSYPSVVDTLCRDAQGMVSRYQHGAEIDGGACVLSPMALRESVAIGFSPNSATPANDGVDGIGMPVQCAGPECQTFFWSGSVNRVVGSSDRMIVLPPLQKGQIFSFEQPSPSALASGAGLISLQTQNFSPYVAGGIDERPNWIIVGSGLMTGSERGLSVVDLRQVLATGQGDPYFFLPPIAGLRNSSDFLPEVVGLGVPGVPEVAHGVVATDRTGVEWLTIGVGDRVWAEPHADTFATDGGSVEMGIKVVPLPFGELASLALGAPAPGANAPLLDGYAVISQRLFHVRVPTPELWLSDEIRIPDVVPVKVWRQDARGRVGTADGQVFGLPIPVALSGKVEGGVALDYADLCGQGIALTPTGVYRLVATDQPLGQWERIPIETANPGADKLGATFVPPLHVAREGNLEKVFVFNKLGLVIELKAQCGD